MFQNFGIRQRRFTISCSCCYCSFLSTVLRRIGGGGGHVYVDNIAGGAGSLYVRGLRSKSGVGVGFVNIDSP